MDESFYYSLDRLVEFGLGASVASQMISSMNQSIGSMTTPGAGNVMLPNDGALYYVANAGTAEGPFSATELARMLRDGDVGKETYIWRPGMVKCDLALNMPEVLRLVAIVPPAL